MEGLGVYVLPAEAERKHRHSGGWTCGRPFQWVHCPFTAITTISYSFFLTLLWPPAHCRIKSGWGLLLLTKAIIDLLMPSGPMGAGD